MTPDQQINRANNANFSAALADMQAREDYEDAIEERAEALMSKGGRYYPWDAEGIGEAIGNAPAEQSAPICEAMNHGDWNERTCRMLGVLVQDYWNQRATEQACAELEREALEEREL